VSPFIFPCCGTFPLSNYLILLRDALLASPLLNLVQQRIQLADVDAATLFGVERRYALRNQAEIAGMSRSAE
jgi:hypothetical protein